MKITKLGLIQAFKNVGLFLAAYQLSGIQADLTSFIFNATIFICISVPSDLYLLNREKENK